MPNVEHLTMMKMTTNVFHLINLNAAVRCEFCSNENITNVYTHCAAKRVRWNDNSAAFLSR